MDMLRHYTTENFPKPARAGGKVLTIDSKMTVKKAMDVLVENNILSAPVVDTSKPPESKYVGMIDMVDIVAFIVEVFKETELLGEGFEALMEQVERFSTTKVRSAADISNRNPFVTVPVGAPLVDIIKLLSRYGIHRVGVLDANLELVNLITQSAVVDLLATPENLKKLCASIGNKSLQELGIIQRGVFTVSIDARTIDAFKEIHEKRVSAVAVVDASKRIVATISVRDIRLIAKHPSGFHRLYMPIHQFLQAMHMNEVNVRQPAISCHETTTLADAIATLAANHIHRVWVIDEHNVPTGVVSLREVLLALLAQEEASAQL